VASAVNDIHTACTRRRPTKVDAAADQWPRLVRAGGPTLGAMHAPGRNRLADAGLVILAVLLGGLFFSDSLASGERGPAYPYVDLGVGAAACAALLIRRRWPVVLAALLIPALAASAAAMGATAIAIGSVAVHRSRRVTAVVLAAHAVTVTALFALAAWGTREFWIGLTVVLALDVAAVASGLLVRSQRLLVRSLRDRAREAEEGQRLRAEEARHAERERIAREMHDVLAHRISLLAVHAGALQVRRFATDEERAAAGVIRQCAYEALEDLREVIRMVRDDDHRADPDRPQPVLTDVPALVEQSRRAGMRVELDGVPDVPDGIGRHGYRIVQEGLTNARKHSPGAVVVVSLTTVDDAPGLVVDVTNALTPQMGPADLPGAGSGLVGLRERVHIVGGRLEHGPTADGQFRLHAWLPWRP
jgi:signal transduction histidine kinase